MTAAIVAVVLAGAVVAVVRSASTSAGPTATDGREAIRIASGQWSIIPASPLPPECATALLSTGPAALLLSSGSPSSCPVGAALYDPQANAWRRLANPPRSLRSDYWSTTWSGTAAVIVTASGRVATFRPADNRWTTLPRPPVRSAGASPVADRGRIILLGAGRKGRQVLSYDGARWHQLPALPRTYNQVGYLAGQTLWVLATEVTRHRLHNGFGERSYLHAFRLGRSGWKDEPVAKALPPSTERIQAFGDGVLVTGNYCPPFASCPPMGPHPVLTRLGTRDGRALPPSPFTPFGVGAFEVSGDAVIAIDTNTSGASPVRIGAVAAWDSASRRWHLAALPPKLRRGYGEAWTAGGLVEIGRFAASCGCRGNGILLRPAR